MPKTIFLTNECERSGIDITWTKSKSQLHIGGWYDTCCGIEPTNMTLKEFFDKLGITEKDCKRAFSS